MSAAGYQSAPSTSSDGFASAARRSEASSNSRFIRSCNVTRSCNGFHCAITIPLVTQTVSLRFTVRNSSTRDRKLTVCSTSSRRRCGLNFQIHLLASSRDFDRLSGQDLPAQKFYCQRILYQRLNRALERTGAVVWIVAFASQQLTRRIVQH